MCVTGFSLDCLTSLLLFGYVILISLWLRKWANIFVCSNYVLIHDVLICFDMFWYGSVLISWRAPLGIFRSILQFHGRNFSSRPLANRHFLLLHLLRKPWRAMTLRLGLFLLKGWFRVFGRYGCRHIVMFAKKITTITNSLGDYHLDF